MTILVPDLLGHGRSAKPRSDYSLGARQHAARPARRARSRPGQPGRARARRPDRPAVRLPAPLAVRRADGGVQRRAGRRRGRAAAGGRTTGLRTGPATAHRAAPRPADHRRAPLVRCPRSAMSTTFSGSTARWPPPKPGRRCWPPCAQSSPRRATSVGDQPTTRRRADPDPARLWQP